VQREDDKEAVVAKRLAEYDERTQPLVAYYASRPGFHLIDGNRSVDDVFRALQEKLAVAQ
jgi:adenylate kinase